MLRLVYVGWLETICLAIKQNDFVFYIYRRCTNCNSNQLEFARFDKIAHTRTQVLKTENRLRLMNTRYTQVLQICCSHAQRRTCNNQSLRIDRITKYVKRAGEFSNFYCAPIRAFQQSTISIGWQQINGTTFYA